MLAELVLALTLATHTPTNVNIEQKTLHDTNQYRAAHGRHTLVPDYRLSTAARQRAEEMMLHDYLSHEDPEGRPYTTTITALAPTATGLNENIVRVMGHATDDTQHWNGLNVAILALQLSQGHKTNWLNPNHNYVGIGVATGPSGRWARSMYLVMVFAGGFKRA